MRAIFFLFIIIVSLSSCKERQGKEAEAKSSIKAGAAETAVLDYSSYHLAGAEFDVEPLVLKEEMAEEYADLKPGDSLNLTFRTRVNSVCKKKGCWMRLELNEEEEVMVKFRDYGFFVPKDIEQKEVLVHGKAFVTELSVERRRHYAEDGGASPEEIAAITEPEKTLSFLADGVLIEP